MEGDVLKGYYGLYEHVSSVIPWTVVLLRQYYSNPLDMDVLWPCSFPAQDLARAARIDTAVDIRTSDELKNTTVPGTCMSPLFLLCTLGPDYVRVRGVCRCCCISTEM